MEQIGDVNADADDIEFDGRKARDNIYSILQDTSVDYLSRLNRIYSQYSIEVHEDGWWLEALESLEYLDESHRELFMNYSSALRPDSIKETDAYLERFLAYLIYRHCTEAFDSEDFYSRLSFCLFCERLLASLICVKCAKSLNDVVSLASIISEELEYSLDNTFAIMDFFNI